MTRHYCEGVSTPDLLPHLRRARDLMDSCYADDIDVAIVAQRVGVSKYHFIRSFSAEYGQTPAQYLAHRRIERAQDLLRATNLTVTEVCMLVGYTSLGSFSAKFPRSSVRRHRRSSSVMAAGGSRTFPAATCSCVACRREQFRRSGPKGLGISVLAMITNVSLVTVYVTDQDEAKKFYTDVLGFEAAQRRQAGRLPLGHRRASGSP